MATALAPEKPLLGQKMPWAGSRLENRPLSRRMHRGKCSHRLRPLSGAPVFANGAATAAMSYAFGQMAQREQDQGRPLTENEIAEAREAYGDLITDYESVRVFDRKWMPFQGKYVAMAPDGNIYWPAAAHCQDLTQCTITYPGGYERTTLDIFIHEMGHVMQHQQGVNVVLRALPHHVWSGVTFGRYNPYMSRSQFDQTPSPQGLNVEAQADWYMHRYCDRTGNC